LANIQYFKLGIRIDGGANASDKVNIGHFERS
jgi:hypothetical protein